MAPPQIHTYHCICASLLLSSTHSLSSLPQRANPSDPSTPSLDSAIILPLPSSPPTLSNLSTSDAREGNEELPAAGYTVLLGLVPDRKTTIIRREDGFEKRILYRCSRCRLAVGYEISGLENAGGGDVEMDGVEGNGKGKEAEEVYEGKVIYILPAGVVSTDFMVGSVKEGGRKIGDGDVELGAGKGVVACFE